MDTITGLHELDAHLDKLAQAGDPQEPVNAKLFDDVELQLTDENMGPMIPMLLPKISIALQHVEEPKPLIDLATKLLRPVTFKQALSLAPVEALVQALQSNVDATVILAMTIIHKAVDNLPDSVDVVLDLLPTFIESWLVASSVGVGQKGVRVLGDLLDKDCRLPPPPSPATPFHERLSNRTEPGTGKIWDRLLKHVPTYRLFLELISGKHPVTRDSPRQLSLAQARVLGLLPRLAMIDFKAVTSPTPVALNTIHGGTNGNYIAPRLTAPLPVLNPASTSEGILEYAALRMVDPGDELLMLTVVEFFEALISLTRLTEHTPEQIAMLRRLCDQGSVYNKSLMSSLLVLPSRTVEDERELLTEWIQTLFPTRVVVVQPAAQLMEESSTESSS